jgi:hypothetical protein
MEPVFVVACTFGRDEFGKNEKMKAIRSKHRHTFGSEGAYCNVCIGPSRRNMMSAPMSAIERIVLQNSLLRYQRAIIESEKQASRI